MSVLVSSYDCEYEKVLRDLVAFHQDMERRHRGKRQALEAKLRDLEAERLLESLRHGCPLDQVYGCRLQDGTACPHYDDGVCLKEEAEQ